MYFTILMFVRADMVNYYDLFKSNTKQIVPQICFSVITFKIYNSVCTCQFLLSTSMCPEAYRFSFHSELVPECAHVFGKRDSHQSLSW